MTRWQTNQNTKRPKQLQKNLNDNEKMRFTVIMTRDSHHNSCNNVFDHNSSFILKMQTWKNIFHYREWVINLEKFSHLSVFHLEECPFVVKPAQHFRRGQKCTFKSRKVLLQSPRSTSWICSWVLLLSKYRTIFVGNLFSSCHWWVPFCLPDPVEYSDHVSNNLHPSNFEHGSCRISSK